MGSNEGFKEYAQKWRDLARRVQPPLFDQELVDMFMGTIIGERVESGIKSGKIPMAVTSNVVKKPFSGKKETNTVHG